MVATKAHDVESAATAALPLLGDDTIVLPIQNGLGSRERVAAIVGPERVMTGVVGGFGASIVEPGHVHHHGMELVRFGERSGPVTERVELSPTPGARPGSPSHVRRRRPAGVGEADLQRGFQRHLRDHRRHDRRRDR